MKKHSLLKTVLAGLALLLLIALLLAADSAHLFLP